MDQVTAPHTAVVLSMLALDDLQAHLAGEDDELVRWLNGGRGSVATVDAHLRRCTENWYTGGPVHAFGIRAGDRPRLAGTIEVQWDQPYLRPGQANLAYGLYPAWRGRGVASRAVTLACEHALANGVTEAVIRADPDNHASLAVARRCGFVELSSPPDSSDPLQWWVRRLAPPREVPDSLPLTGLVLLVGAPGAGKSTFARSLVQLQLLDRNAIVSADQIAEIMFWHLPAGDARDPAVFAEVDRRVDARLGAGLPVVVDATNVRSAARTRLIAIALRHQATVTALRFTADPATVLAQNAARPRPLPADVVLAYIAIMREQAASTACLHAEGIDTIVDVPNAPI